MESEARVQHEPRSLTAAEDAPFVNLRDPARRLGPDGKPAVSRRAPIWEDVPDEKWNDWRWQLSNRVNDLDEIEQILKLTDEEREGLSAPDKFRVDVTPYFVSLIDPKNPTTRSAARSSRSAASCTAFTGMMEDSLAEDRHSPVPGLVHRYPDRVLMLITTQCASYCRYCTRSRIVGDPTQNFNRREHEAQLDYIRRTPADPRRADLRRRRPDARPEAPRVGDARPARDPARRDRPDRLAGAGVPAAADRRRAVRDARQVPPAVDEHPRQPPQRDHARARPRLRHAVRAGIPLGNQSVLLAGVNDCVHIQRELVQRLVEIRVRPYYIYQCDLVEGAGHFRTPVGKGLEIIEGLRGHTAGYAVPQFIVDAPGGGGKIPVMPNYLVSLLGPQGHPPQLRGLHHHLRGAGRVHAARPARTASTARTRARSPARRASRGCSTASGCGSSRRASRRSTRAAPSEQHRLKDPSKWVPYGVGAIEGTGRRASCPCSSPASRHRRRTGAAASRRSRSTDPARSRGRPRASRPPPRTTSSCSPLLPLGTGRVGARAADAHS